MLCLRAFAYDQNTCSHNGGIKSAKNTDHFRLPWFVIFITHCFAANEFYEKVITLFMRLKVKTSEIILNKRTRFYQNSKIFRI